MKVQIFQPFTGGHNTLYVSLLLPALVRLRDLGKLDSVTLTTTRWVTESMPFLDSISDLVANIDLDVIPAGDIWDKGYEVTAMLLDSVRRNRPDVVISPSANNGALSLALACLYRSDLRAHGIGSIGVIHNGFYGNANSVRDRIRDCIHRISRRFSPWSELLIVNPLLHDFISTHGSAGEKRRIRLLPDPVEVHPPIGRAEARSCLGIPVDGTYIGQIGKTDGRKAIPELIAAFRDAHLGADQRLLLAGNLYRPHRELVDREYQDLLRQGRLILIDRYLSVEEIYAARCATDLIAVAHDTKGSLSGSLLAAVSAERPVLAHRDGYTGMICDQFGVGDTVDIRSHSEFTQAIKVGMQEAAGYRITPKARRLIEFHDPRNYVDTLLQRLYARLQLPSPTIKTWQWALHG